MHVCAETEATPRLIRTKQSNENKIPCFIIHFKIAAKVKSLSVSIHVSYSDPQKPWETALQVKITIFRISQGCYFTRLEAHWIKDSWRRTRFIGLMCQSVSLVSQINQCIGK